MLKKMCLVGLLVVLWLPINATTFAQAKKQMYTIYQDHRTAVYCGCPFNGRKQVDLGTCGYEVRRSAQRARRTEAEHIRLHNVAPPNRIMQVIFQQALYEIILKLS